MVIDGGYDDLRIIVILSCSGGVIYTYWDSDSGELRAIKHSNSRDLPDRDLTAILNRLSGIATAF